LREFFLPDIEWHVIDCHRCLAEVGDISLDMNWVLLYTIEDGKIKSMTNFPVNQHEAGEFFCKVYRLKDVPDRLANN
jgi:ketosteroid isomerase-like protein